MNAREPQVRMVMEGIKRAEGDSREFGCGVCSTSGEERAPTKTAPTQTGQTVDGVYTEPPRAAPKKQFWTPKPPRAKLDKKIEEVLKPKGKKPVQQPVAPKATPPRPRAQPNPPRRQTYHCEFCQRYDHLEEFCFRRKRVERQERAWGNQDQFYQGGRQGPPHHGEMRDRFVGGRGGGFQACAPGGERRFAGRGQGCFGRGSGSRDRGFESFDRGFGRPCFGGRGHRAPSFDSAYFDYAYPSYEQMARHWFSSFSNPSAGPFAHPRFH